MAKRDKDQAECQITPTKLKAADAGFGVSSIPYEIKLMSGLDELQSIELPLDEKLCARGEVNLASIRVFRWDDEIERFSLVPDSGIDERWRAARARVDESGIYVAAGASANPWAASAMATLSNFGPLLHDPGLEPILRHRLCPVILCPNMLGEIFERIGDPAQHGLPPLPPGDLCEICTGGGLGHAYDLWPEPIRPGPVPRPCGPCNLSEYLRCNRRVRRRIVWRDTSGSHPYDDWTPDEKAQLAAAFHTISSGGTFGLPETAPATEPLPGRLLTRLSRNDAWRTYLAHLAHTLVVESCGWVAWSIRHYADAELDLLLNSDSLFFPVESDSYTFAIAVHGQASPGDPTRVYNWLRGEALVAPTQQATLGRVFEWGRDNMAHYAGRLTPDNADDHWQYRGLPPVERIIGGTTSSHGFNHWTAGCWGTSGFLQLVLRTINLPATFVINCGHAQPHFPTVGKFLDHGDNPYNSNFRTSGADGVDLLVDATTFASWFDPALTEAELCANIGRRVDELAAP